MAFALLGLRGLFWVRAGVQHLKLIDNTSKSQFMPDDSQGADKDETLWIKACWREGTGDGQYPNLEQNPANSAFTLY